MRFHDADIAPAGASINEFEDNVAEMADYIKAKADAYGKHLLWGTSNLFGHPRYIHGAGSSPYPGVFAFAACQIKNTLDATIKLGGEGYVFWGGREGYDTLLNTRMGFEQENIARLMRLSVDYARAHGFTGYFYIEPKPKEPTKHQYDFDAATAAGFLQKFGLDKDFRLNIEANHATLAGHTFQHDLRVARENGLFGSIDANQGDPNLGWDTDQFPTDVRETTLCMYEVLKAGGFTRGGLNFDAKVRRSSYEFEDIAHAYLSGMDAFALGLKKAFRLIEDGRLDAFVEQRYLGWESGLGAGILSGKETLESLERKARTMGETTVPSGKQEYLENLLNSIIYGE